MIRLLVTGIISILGQVVLLRELSVAFYGVDLIYALALGNWLIWTALGAVIGKGALSPVAAWVQRLFLLFAFLLLLDVVFIRGLRILFSGIPGAYLPFSDQILAMSIALLPIGLLSGLTFQWTAQIYISRGRSLAAAYAIESAGGLAGGLGATLFLRAGMQNLTIAVLCALLSLSVVLFARSPESPRIRAAALGIAIPMLCLLWFTGPLDRAMTAWSHPFLLGSQDSPYGRITVTRQAEQVAVYENDALAFDTEATDAEEFVQMAALLHPRPARVLILGGGISGTVGEVLKHSPEQVDYVELNPFLLNLVVPFLPANLREPLHASAVRVQIDDPRNYLDRPASYDLILIGMPEPDSGQTNRYYTLEFFQKCAARLEPDGIIAFRLRSAENFWTPQQAARALSIYAALHQALPHIQVLPGGTNIFAASRQPLVKDPALLAARLKDRGIETRLVSAPYIRYFYQNERFARIERLLQAGQAPPNTDARPICYPYTLMIWLSRFYPDLAAWDPSALASWRDPRAAPWLAVALAVPALFVLGRRRAASRRVLLVGVAGFIGMILETLLMLHYQAKSGILFQNIGVLLMSFMAGLALGSLAMDRWIFARTHSMPAWFGPILIGGFTLGSLAAGARIGAASSGGLAETTGLLLATGVLVSAAFAYASLEEMGNQRRMVAPLYAADLIGGCLGSLTGSLLMIPILGMDATAVSMAPLALFSLLLLKPRHAH